VNRELPSGAAIAETDKEHFVTQPRTQASAPRWRAGLAPLLLGLLGGGAAFLGLLLATDVISLRYVVATRSAPLGMLIDRLHRALPGDLAHGLEAVAAAAGLLLLAVGCAFASISALRRGRRRSRPVQASLLLVALASGGIALALVELSLHFAGLWPNPPAHDQIEGALFGAVHGLWGVVRRFG
jgi:hypothetical protein